MLARLQSRNLNGQSPSCVPNEFLILWFRCLKAAVFFCNIDNLFCLYFALQLSQFAVIFNYPDDAVVHRISAQTPSSGDMSELR